MHCRYQGMRPLTNDSSYPELTKWLSNMESSLAAISNFAAIDFDRLKKSQLGCLVRGTLATVLDGSGAGRLIVKAKTLVGKVTHQRL